MGASVGKGTTIADHGSPRIDRIDEPAGRHVRASPVRAASHANAWGPSVHITGHTGGEVRSGLLTHEIEDGRMGLPIHHPRYDKLREHLKAMRLAAKLTQTQIAAKLGLEQSYVSKIERGERYVDMLFYLDWCRACDVGPVEAARALEKRGIYRSDS